MQTPFANIVRIEVGSHLISSRTPNSKLIYSLALSSTTSHNQRE